MLKRRVDIKLLLALVPFCILILAFEILPTLSVVVESFKNDEGTGFSFEQYVTAFTKMFYLQAIKNSLLISAASSFIAIIAGLFIAYAITRVSERTRTRVLMISNMTSNFAGIPLAFAYIILLGSNGVFTLLFEQWGLSIFSGFNLYSWSGLILVYVYFQIPLAALLLYPTYYGIREEWREASALLGAGAFQYWRRIALPLLLPAAAGTFTILFANAMGAYATAYALVGANYNLLAIRISSLVAGEVITRPQLGSALAMVLGLTMVLSLWINDRLMKRVRRDLG
ncbi:ABC transporter permease subunit [Paenibacillus sp. J22TS3]|uniref:ABC transporter permease n=1 Tax=Paenibacillus sp. J22TS3 TaxID=2807192 RepID=UPI001B0B6D63|nr:ABC transporter permease subunit [Paenibacillus sp. J22TS3]GIP19833.1 ABC transporter permease [Paenibacillus sp. J22TS3]